MGSMEIFTAIINLAMMFLLGFLIGFAVGERSEIKFQEKLDRIRNRRDGIRKAAKGE